jgi:cell division protein FtsL
VLAVTLNTLANPFKTLQIRKEFKMTNNKKLLTIIAVVLVGILSVLIMQTYNSRQSSKGLSGSIDEIIDSAHKGAEEFEEEVKDEIDDHTTDHR